MSITLMIFLIWLQSSLCQAGFRLERSENFLLRSLRNT